MASLAPQYAALAGKGDAALVLCGKVKTAAAGSLAESKAAAQECLNSYSGYVAEMKAINWGPVQPQANRVIDAIDKLDVLMVRMAKATSAAALTAAYGQLTPAGVALLVAATALRVALGLPPAHL